MPRARILRGAGALLVLLVPVAAPLPGGAPLVPPTWRAAGQVGGSTQAVAVQGNYAYVGVGLRLVVLDISDPARLREAASTLPFEYFVQDVTVSGNYAYVAAGGAGLRIIDISNPLSPVEAGYWKSRGFAESVAVEGNFAYVANGPYGMRVLDVADRARPVEAGAAYVLNYAFHVAVADRRAYIAAAGAGLLIADISNPRRPMEVGSLDTTGYARGVAAAGHIAYVADEWEGLKVVDVSDPAHPFLAGTQQTPGWAFAVSVWGTTGYVADAFGGLRVLDLSEPVRPTETAHFEAAGGHAARVTAAGGVAFVADRNRGLSAVSLTPEPGADGLVEVGLYSPLTYAHGVAVAGQYAYVAAYGSGLRVVDVSDAAHPTEVGVYQTESEAWSVVVEGRYAYVATHGSLHVVDVTDPAQPVRAGWLSILSGGLRDLAVSGGVAYMPGECCFETADVADPAAPRLLGLMDVIPDTAVGVDVSGSLVYLATQNALKVVDVSDPSAPVVVGECRELGAEHVRVAGGYAYTGYMGGLAVIDVSDPGRPVLVATYNSEIRVERVALDGGVALLAHGSNGVSMVDISVPSRPTLIETHNTAGYAEQALAAGDRVYVADGSGGLLILEKTLDNAVTQSLPRRTAKPLPGGAAAPRAVPRKGVPVKLDRAATAPRPRPVDDACVVNSTADSGPGSLRACVASATEGSVITFDPAVFPPDNPATIALLRCIPLEQGGITIDGSNAGVILDGSMAQEDIGLSISTDDNDIYGLQIVGFPKVGLNVTGARNRIGGDRTRGSGPTGEGNVISGNGWLGLHLWGADARENVVTGNLIGTDAWGTQALANGQYGVALQAGATLNRIGGATPGERNVISGNQGGGICLCSNVPGNTIIGNYIGVDESGTAALANEGYAGIIIARANQNRIGGPSDGERNVISGNRSSGVAVGHEAADNIIAGNYIGVDAAGSAALPNQAHGVTIEVGSYHNSLTGNVIVGGGGFGLVINDWRSDYNTVTGNLIGTDAAGTRRIASGMGGAWIGMGAAFNRIGGFTAAERNVIAGGIQFPRGAQPGNLVVGNFIGTDISGTQALDAGDEGVTLSDSSRAFIGGATAEEGNVISGYREGIRTHPDAEYAFIAGNSIGTDASGKVVLGNRRDGIGLYGGEHNFIQGNRIAYNLGSGITAYPLNTIRANSIYGNSGHGIWGRSPADGGLLPPVITAVSATTVSGLSCAGCEVEIFSDIGSQGRAYEGSTEADASGAFRFDKRGPLTGPYVTATATDAAGTTSAFSVPQAVPRM